MKGEEAVRLVLEHLAAALGVRASDLAPSERFRRLGLDSAKAVVFVKALGTACGRALAPTIVWQHPTPLELAGHLSGEAAAARTVDDDVPRVASSEDVAVIGIACRFPGAADPAAYWSLLREGREAIVEVPADRWDLRRFYDADVTARGKMSTRWAGFLPRVDAFDWSFFGISPREARQMDPQQRLVLELAWEALEDALLAPGGLKDTATGVYLGAMWSDYARLGGGAAAIDQHTATGQDLSIISARVSYTLGLTGPSLVVNTACSSSLVAVHLARRSLLAGESNLAIAGGVNLILAPESTIAMSKFGAMAPDGRSKAFDARADGYVRGEGGGVVVLKRLADARADGDRVYGVIRGSAVNNDGFSNGLTAPSPKAQEAVLRAAYRDARVALDEVQYVEAHGTGTMLGDPIEANALGAVLGVGRSPSTPLRIGSVKTNVGHLEAAAGIAGLIKVILSSWNGLLVPTRGFEAPNPHIAFDELRIAVQATVEPWVEAGGRRLAGVSSFGFGGTNAHVVWEHRPRPQPAAACAGVAAPVAAPRVVLLFGGQGSQWQGMGLSLLRDDRAGREVLERLDRVMRPITGWSLVERLRHGRPIQLDETAFVQPAIFAMQVAMARALLARGLRVDAVVGQSMGEIAAAHVVGALSLEDAARVACVRSQVVATVRSGRMATLGLSLDETRELIDAQGAGVSVAVCAAPRTTVVAGDEESIVALCASLEARGTFARVVRVDYASHSRHVDDVLPTLRERLGAVRAAPSRDAAFWSTVRGRQVDGAELDAEYWVSNLREPVLLAPVIDQLTRSGPNVFVEVDPHPVLEELVRQTVEAAGTGDVVLPCGAREDHEGDALAETLVRLAEHGVALAPGAEAASEVRSELVIVSARSAGALRDAAGRLRGHVEGPGAPALADVAYSAATTRTLFEERAALVVGSREELAAALGALARGEEAGAERGSVTPGRRPRLAWLFTGQGAQSLGMGRGLYGEWPAFREAFDQAASAVNRHLSRPIEELMWAPEGAAAEEALKRTSATQPAMFVLEWALAALWSSWGVQPDYVAGHSIGEIAAAAVAGALDLNDAARFVCARGRLMQALPAGGAMLAIAASEEDVRPVLEGKTDASLAAVNGPRAVVASGARRTLEAVAAVMAQREVPTKWLDVSHAFHSPLMEPILDELRAVAATMAFKSPRIPLLSTADGAVDSEDAATVEHWVRHARGAVAFAAAARRLVGEGVDAVVEMGPRPTLLPFVAAAAGAERIRRWPALRGPAREREAALRALAGWVAHGGDVDWREVFVAGGRRVDLPTYPWQRERCWLEEPAAAVAPTDDASAPVLEVDRMRGAMVSSAPDRVFESRMPEDVPAWARQHEVGGDAVAPGALIVEIMGAAAEAARTRTEVRNVVFERALVLDAVSRRLQVVVTSDRRVVVRSGPADDGDRQGRDDRWVAHATAELAEAKGAAGSFELPSLEARCPTEVVPDELYAHLQAQGLGYGPAFRVIATLRAGAGEALARLRAEGSASSGGYGLHPTIIDAGLQAVVAVASNGAGGSSRLLPFSASRFVVSRSGGPAEFVWVQWGRVDGGVTADVTWLDRAGVVCAQMTECRFREGGAIEVPGAGRVLVGAIEWRPIPVAPPGGAPARALVAAGDVARVADLARRVSAIRVIGVEEVSTAPAAEDVVCLWDRADGGERAMAIAREAMAIARAAIANENRPRIWWVTRGAVAVERGEEIAPAAAAAWGLASVLFEEHPEVRLTLVDVDRLDSPDDLDRILADAAEDESRVAWRRAVRYVARVVRREGPALPEADDHRLEVTRSGTLDGLAWSAASRRAPQPTEIEIEAQACGLNFRDVLSALGQYPEAIELGAECAGIVRRVGAQVADLKPGDRVLAIGAGALRRFVTTDPRLAAKVPEGLSVSQAATSPIAFATALHALRDLARLARGERVLIHAAAGGVGLAAVAIAQHLGAEVFATAHPSKWDVLRDLGVTHLASSRDAIFAQAFHGGVDVVLNSLTGAQIDASLGLLRAGGRFIEMGKADLRSPDEVANRNPGVAYQAFDLMKLETGELGRLVDDVVDGFERGWWGPLRVRTFGPDDAQGAFRWMAQGRQIGKVAIAPVVRSWRRDGTFIVTGGLGALGRQAALELARGGARHLVLVGRRGAETPGAEELVRELSSLGAEATIAAVDATDFESIARIVASVPAEWPLRGVVHAAGELDDAMLLRQTDESLSRSMSAKVIGAWTLHRACEREDLDFFTVFSSVAGVLGIAGQAGYAAANAYLDGLCAHRVGRGLPAQSLCWGPWDGPGMVEALASRARSRLTGRGLRLLRPADGRRLLREALGRWSGQSLLMAADLDALAAGTARGAAALWRSAVSVGPNRPSTDAARAPTAALTGDLVAAVRSDVAQVLGMADPGAVPTDRPLKELGLDSLMAVELRNLLSRRLGRPLPATLAFDHPTVASISVFLTPSPGTVNGSPPPVAPTQVRRNRSSTDEGASDDAVAVVAIGCRFPGGIDDPEAFWRFLERGGDAIEEIPKDRWNADAWYDPNPDAPGKIVTRVGGFLSSLDSFDAPFFGLSTGEAPYVDPQERLLLETTWEAIERSGIRAEELMGSDTGVFMGLSGTEYQARVMSDVEGMSPYAFLGTSHSAMVGRISYWLGLRGPNLAVDTACSSSLVAVHLACRSLLAGESSLAISGGANVLLGPAWSVYFSRLRALSPSGRCRTFSRDADGYVRSEGAAVVVLQRLEDARRQRRPVIAVIRGSAMNQDGRSNGPTAPSGPAQQLVIREALRRAGVAPADVSYVECHGTGTPLGDPIEVQALGAVFGEGRDATAPLVIGSVKTNVGHMEAAAGIGGLVKVAMSLRHGRIPKSLHLSEPNPHIPWDSLPVDVATNTREWPSNGKARTAGVSSFGIGGTNAHVVLQEAPPEEPTGGDDRAGAPALVIVSAKDDVALAACAGRLRAAIPRMRHSGVSLYDLAKSCAVHRSLLERRVALVENDWDELEADLRALEGGATPERALRGHAELDPGRAACLFPGEAAWVAGTGIELVEAWPVFREAADEAWRALAGSLLPSAKAPTFRQAARGLASEPAEGSRVELTFALGWGLAALWRSWGVDADYFVGESAGAVAAACVAGRLSLTEGAAAVREIARGDHPGAGWALYPRARGDDNSGLERRVWADIERALVEDRTRVIVVMGRIGAALEAPPNARGHQLTMLPSLAAGRSEPATLLEGVGRWIVRRGALDWRALFTRGARPVVLPTYAWQRQRHWIAPMATPPRFNPRAGQSSLLGQRLPVAGSDATYERMLDVGCLPWLRDHRVGGEVLFPAAATVEMIRAAAADFSGGDTVALTGVTFHAPLRLDETPRRLQIVLTQGGSRATLYGHAEADTVHEWTAYASADVSGQGGDRGDADAEGAWASCQTPLASDGFYAALRAASMDYGAAFRSLREARIAAGRAQALVTLPIASDAAYGIHPILLDAAFQAALAACDDGIDEAMLPFALDSVTVRGRSDSSAIVRAVIETRTTDGFVANVQILDPDTLAVIVDVRGLRARALRERRAPTGDVYRQEWADSPIADRPRRALTDACAIVSFGSADAESVSNALGPRAQLVNPASLAADASFGHIVALWDAGVDARAASRAAEEVLAIVQAAAKVAPRGPRLWLVTKRAVAVGDGERVMPGGAFVRGFGRSVMEELPDLRCTLIDIASSDAGDPVSDLVAAVIVDEILAGGDDREIAWRGERRCVARVVPLSGATGAATEDRRLEAGRDGRFESLRFVSARRPPPRAGEIEIEVAASGINFRDILSALGRYPEDVALGAECAGTVRRVGPGVEDLSAGARVMAFGSGTFRRFVATDARLAVPVPEGLAMAEAAASPVAFATAWYALRDLAGVRPGERVLVHAAAGGVGMAAVQVARSFGAEVVATAHPSKWDVVKALGVERVASSRDPSFARGLALEPGSVDVVLNALTGPFIAAGLELLRGGGRFIEMGKSDLRRPERVAAEHPGVIYRAFDLMEAGPVRLREILADVAALLSSGGLSPLPVKVARAAEAESAFRLISQGRHIGKVVIVPERAALRTDGTFLVTGGLGGLGAAAARELAARGVEHLVLLGRRGMETPGAVALAEELRRAGALAVVVACDVADRGSLERALLAIPPHRPLRGVIHAAGVLEDATIAQQTVEGLRRVLAPKIDGAWNLHELTLGADLDLFVMFSSVAAVLGAAGQAAYAGANAFLDALVSHRASFGLRAQSQAWGPWADVGMAAGLNGPLQKRLARRGLGALSLARGRALFVEGCASQEPHLLLMKVDLPARLKVSTAGESTYAERETPGPTGTSSRRPSPRAELPAGPWSSLPVEQRVAAVTHVVRTEVARVLSMSDPADLPLHTPLLDLGLDSLMAIELRNALAARITKNLPPTLAFDHPTAAALIDYLGSRLLDKTAPAVEA